MSRMFDVRVTVTLDGDERDVSCRAFVDIYYGGSGVYAELDGDPTVLLRDEWWDLDQLTLGDGDAQRIEDALIQAALEDDTDQCIERSCA